MTSDYLRRTNDVVLQAFSAALGARDSVVGLRHLAAALLSDSETRLALAPQDIPSSERLFLGLTDVEPIDEQFAKWGERRGPNLVVLPSVTATAGPDLLNCLESVLSGNELSGLRAHLMLLERVLGDPGVRDWLAQFLDVSALAGSLDHAMKDHGLR
jgi:hypothetical protein